MKTSIQKGHCQVCGSVQRIHNNGTNKIFNHGFTRSGGFGYWTSAPCWGSSHQALEISCDIVEDTIARAYDIIEKIQVRVTAQEEETADMKWYVIGTDRKHNVKKYDAVHLSMNWSAITAITFIYLKLTNTPFYFSAMGWLSIQGRAIILKHIYFNVITLPLVRSAKMCVAVSKREVNEYIGCGVSPEKIVYIPNGIESAEFEKDDGGAHFRKKYNIDKRPIIFFIGRIDLIKGPDILLRAFGKICNDFPSYQLIIAGNNLGYLSTIKSECKALKLVNKVTFLGPIIGEDKVSAYHSAKLVVIPSRFDSMTIVALEAAASSAAILITKECDFSELALASSGIEVNANEVEVEEGIRLALSSKVDLKKLGNNAKNFVLNNYDWNIRRNGNAGWA